MPALLLPCYRNKVCKSQCYFQLAKKERDRKKKPLPQHRWESLGAKRVERKLEECCSEYVEQVYISFFLELNQRYFRVVYVYFFRFLIVGIEKDRRVNCSDALL